MKALLVIFAIYLNYIICQDSSNKNGKGFPKKMRSYDNGRIVLNSGSYKFKPNPIEPTNLGDSAYTVFQVVAVSKPIPGVPDSPYFPVDRTYNHKPRVKKVLPEFSLPSLRRKRAVLDETPVVKNENKEEISATVKTPEVKAEKIVETTPTPTLTTQPKPTINEEKPKVETSATPTLGKQKEEAKEIKEESKSTKKVDPEGETKTSPDHESKRSGSPQTTAKTVKKVDLRTTKKVVPKKPASNVRAKSKSKGKAIKLKGANVSNKKNNKTSKINSAGKNKKQQKLQKRQKKPKTKNRAQSKKAQKTKQTNGTRTGKKLKAQRRLTSAREAMIEDYPYVVSIQKNEEHWCSGALLNPRLVITTANCLWKARRISRMKVRAGSRYTDRGGQMASIQEVMKHPGWGLRKSPNNDVALVLLNKDLKFSDSIHGVDLPNRVMFPAFDDAWVTSWGSDRRDGVFNDDATALQVYHTRLMDRAKCNNVTMRFSVYVTENFICLTQSGKTAPCTRDTGAPAVSDGVLWGLASWGIRKLCGTERFPAVFSFLGSHSNLDFITNATHFLMADQRLSPFGDRFPDSFSSSKEIE